MKYLHALVVSALISATANAAPPAGSPASTSHFPRGTPFVALQSQVDNLSLSFTSVEERVTVIEQNIAALQQTAADLQAQITSNDGEISSLQDQLTAANQLIYQLTTELNQTKEVLATKQNIINGVCTEGEYIVGINQDGSLTCRTDAGAQGLVRYSVSKTQYLQECGLINPNCGNVPADTVVATCPQGSVVTGGGYSVDPWVDVSATGISGNGYYASAAVAPLFLWSGGQIIVEATCIALVQ